MRADTVDEPGRASRARWMWLGVVLLVAGLCGHLFAAQAIAGRGLPERGHHSFFVKPYVAYRDHLGGFILLTAVTAVILWLLGRKLWRGRPDITVLLLGAVQALAGGVIYLNRYNV